LAALSSSQKACDMPVPEIHANGLELWHREQSLGQSFVAAILATHSASVTWHFVHFIARTPCNSALWC
jgi:hypothetical protein